MTRTNPDRESVSLDAILAQTRDLLAPVFAQIDWAEDEIDRAQRRHPGSRNAIYHAFLLLLSTHDRMQQEFVYRSHCRELLDRVATHRCTRPGTAAEVAIALAVASQAAPLSTTEFGLYSRMWTVAGFPHLDAISETAVHYEAIASTHINELEQRARAKLAVPTRVLGKVECDGRHHGEPILCEFTEPSTTPAMTTARNPTPQPAAAPTNHTPSPREGTHRSADALLCALRRNR